MELLERLLEIVSRNAFVSIYRNVITAIVYDIGDGADARRILAVMDTHAKSRGFDTAEALADHYCDND